MREGEKLKVQVSSLEENNFDLQSTLQSVEAEKAYVTSQMDKEVGSYIIYIYTCIIYTYIYIYA